MRGAIVMNMRLVLALSFSLYGGTVSAETACREITKLPAAITSGGKYCLTRDLVTTQPSGSAISIRADFVLLDLGGFTLEGRETGAAAVAAYGRRNVSVRNGRIRGFARGVVLAGNGREHVVEALRIDGAGIHVDGPGSAVRQNEITGLRAGKPGISVTGAQTRILDNRVSGGIVLEAAHGAIVERNRVHPTRTQPSAGIALGSSEDVVLSGNTIESPATGAKPAEGR